MTNGEVSEVAGISVVTVTLNNAGALRNTLSSLANLQWPPVEVVIVDGGSTDETAAVVNEFAARLPLSFTSEPDRGIYDAMNKGHARCRGELVHYLNAGDTVFAEPYRQVTRPCLLPVHVYDESGRFFFTEFVRYGGRAYCHQGILFPRGHPPYDETFRVAADLDVMLASFAKGLGALPLISTGGVRFDQGGVSSRASKVQHDEIRTIFHRRLPLLTALRLDVGIWLKNLVPRRTRRTLLALWRHRAPG